MSLHPASRRKIARLKALVVDEVSMMSGEMLQLLDHGLRKVRGCLHKPFGGLQVVFCGDLCQLGPVRERGHSAMEVGRTSDKLDAIPFKNDLMIFQAPAWDDLAFKCKVTPIARVAGFVYGCQAARHARCLACCNMPACGHWGCAFVPERVCSILAVHLSCSLAPGGFFDSDVLL